MPLKPFFQDHAANLRKMEALKTMPRQYLFDNGYITVADLTDEEIFAGCCYDERGKIPTTRGKTNTIPRSQYDNFTRELQQRMDAKLRTRASDLLDVMLDIATDETVEPRDRLEAAKYLYERQFGKTPDKVAISVTETPWEAVFGGMVSTQQQSRALREGSIDGEVVDSINDVDSAQQYAEEVPLVGDEDSRPVWQPTFGRLRKPGDIEDGDHSTADDESATGDGASVQSRRSSEPTTTGYGHSMPTDTPDPRITTPVSAYGFENPANSSSTADIPTPQQEFANAAAKQVELAERRKAAKERIQNAKKARIIKRALGADAFKGKDIIAEVSDDGDLTFGLHDKQAPSSD